MLIRVSILLGVMFLFFYRIAFQQQKLPVKLWLRPGFFCCCFGLWSRYTVYSMCYCKKPEKQ